MMTMIWSPIILFFCEMSFAAAHLHMKKKSPSIESIKYHSSISLINSLRAVPRSNNFESVFCCNIMRQMMTKKERGRQEQHSGHVKIALN